MEEGAALGILQGAKHESDFFAALCAAFGLCEELAHGLQFLGVCAREGDDGLQASDLLIAEPAAAEFVVHLVQADFVQLVDGHGNIGDGIGCAYHFGDACQNFAVVDFDADADAEAGEHFIHDLHQFHFVEERVGAYDIGVALVELAVASLLRAVGAPNGLYLKAFEGHL